MWHLHLSCFVQPSAQKDVQFKASFFSFNAEKQCTCYTWVTLGFLIRNNGSWFDKPFPALSLLTVSICEYLWVSGTHFRLLLALFQTAGGIIPESSSYTDSAMFVSMSGSVRSSVSNQIAHQSGGCTQEPSGAVLWWQNHDWRTEDQVWPDLRLAV